MYQYYFSSSTSALRAPMSHRRTFSDTTFFNSLKKTKQGPSSSGNSPNNTPSLFFPSLSPPPSLTPPPLSKSTSPTIGVGGIDSSPPHHKTSAQEVRGGVHVQYINLTCTVCYTRNIIVKNMGRVYYISGKKSRINFKFNFESTW